MNAFFTFHLPQRSLKTGFTCFLKRSKTPRCITFLIGVQVTPFFPLKGQIRALKVSSLFHVIKSEINFFKGQFMTTSSLSLAHLTDLTLHQDFIKLAQSEREILSKILLHIREVDKRKLFSALDFTSLFDYLTRGLKYSEGSAQRRISAARLSSTVPVVIELIETGDLTLAQTSLIQTQAKAESSERKEEMIAEMKGKNFRESEKIVQSQIQTEKLQNKRRIQFEGDQELLELLEELQHLKNRKGDKITLLKEVCRQEIQRLKKVKFKTLKNPKEASAKKVPSEKILKSNRHIPADVKRIVAERDQHRCVKCGSQRHLQFDHRRPWALGGDHSVGNIRLLCFHCNQRARIEAKLPVKIYPVNATVAG
jgi:5-methylcytosine-specific restriction endonuclease McrA